MILKIVTSQSMHSAQIEAPVTSSVVSVIATTDSLGQPAAESGPFSYPRTGRIPASR
jgi:hypothetical protein